MALSKAQRGVLEEVLRKLDAGPYGGWDNPTKIGNQPITATDVKVWADSWIAEPLQRILDNVDGKINAAQLTRGY